METLLAIKATDKDNVATIFATVKEGDFVEVRDKKGNLEIVLSKSRIPYGHKIAISEILKGNQIIKYGEVIGVSTKEIHKGDYVHIHNLDSMRGRGDCKDFDR